MSDRYDDYARRSVQRGNPNSMSETSRRPAQNGTQRSARNGGYGGQPVCRTTEYAEGGSRRPAQSGTQRSTRSTNYGGQPVRRMTGYAEGGSHRPAQSGMQRSARSTNYGGQPVRRPSGSGQAHAKSGRSVSSQSGYSARQGAARRTGSSNSVKSPSQRAGYSSAGKRSSSGQNFGLMSASTRLICGVLSVALLITICLAVTSRIRSRQPQPTISTDNQQQIAQTENDTQTEAPEITDVPMTTDEPVQQTAEPETVPEAEGRTARIRAIGDVIIDTTMLDNAEISDDVYDFSPLFELVGDVMADADWTMINVETSFRKHKYGYMGYPTFSTPHSLMQDLKNVGVDMLTMCNNHALDGYYDGLKMGLDYADEAGLAHVGAYRTQEEYDTPEVYDINGIKVGMLNYTQYTNGMASLCDKEATIYGMRLMDGADYAGDIAALKDAGAEFTIVIMHWGEEYQRQPEDSTRAVAKKLVAAGADLVIGGHPHVVQPAEYVTATQADGTENTALVLYSIGNFVSEHRHENAAYTDNGIIFDFTLQENDSGDIELVDPNVIPIYMWQISEGKSYDYRAVASGDHIVEEGGEPIEEMSADQYSRMVASYREIEELLGDVLPVRAH